MKNITLAFLYPFLAGMATLLGFLFTYIPERFQNKMIGFSLSLSAGVMISISILSLIPEGFQSLNYSFLLSFFFLFIGVLISILIDYLLSSQQKNSLYRVGLFSTIILVLHNLPEGITTFLTSYQNLTLGLTLSIAIACHNIPEGISIAIPIYYSTNNRKKAFLFTTISGFSEFIGAIFAYFFLSSFISPMILGSIYCMTASIMIYLSLFELIPESLYYSSWKENIIGLSSGIFLMIICIYVFLI